MAFAVRAVYENGQLRLLDPVDLQEGQEVTVSIDAFNEREHLKQILGDLVRWADPSDNTDAWVEAEAEAIDRAFQGTPPLSTYIIEDRGDV
jgi:predicted DNA-binding antitoxin AbrB/MazE fold protein